MQTVRRSGVGANDARIVGRFLDHLGRQGLAWSVVSTNPAVLQAVVNGAITHQGLRSETRPALNRSFNLTLRGPTGLVRLAPFLPEHQSLMTQVRPSTALQSSDLSVVSRFLCFLEQNQLTWSSVSTNVPQLEATVTIAINQFGLNGGTRTALNRAFNLNLRAPRYGGA